MMFPQNRSELQVKEYTKHSNENINIEEIERFLVPWGISHRVKYLETVTQHCGNEFEK